MNKQTGARNEGGEDISIVQVTCVIRIPVCRGQVFASVSIPSRRPESPSGKRRGSSLRHPEAALTFYRRSVIPIVLFQQPRLLLGSGTFVDIRVVRASVAVSRVDRLVLLCFDKKHGASRLVLPPDRGSVKSDPLHTVGSRAKPKRELVVAQLQRRCQILLRPGRAAFGEFWVSREMTRKAQCPDVDEAGAPAWESALDREICEYVRAEIDRQDRDGGYEKRPGEAAIDDVLFAGQK
jgi:hypothetical protein